jgi:hypothetical protein
VRIDVHAHWYTMPFMERMWGLGCTWRPTQQILDAAGATPQRLEHLGQSDRIVLMLRQLWTREMRNLANGQPLKHWRWPGWLETTVGNEPL